MRSSTGLIRRARGAAVTLAALATVGGAIALAGPASAANPSLEDDMAHNSGYGNTGFRNMLFGHQCLDAADEEIWDGGRVQTWGCNGSSNQHWVAYPQWDGTYELRSMRNFSMCLDADTNTVWRNGGRVQIWHCNGQPQQRWRPVGDGLRTAVNDKCLDADANNGDDGTVVQVWDCNGMLQQKWDFGYEGG